LLFSVSIGIYIWWQDRTNTDDNNYATGGRKFSPWPVAFSIGATSISAITMIGTPSEYYIYGKRLKN